MATAPLFSVVVPAYNRGPLIRSSLDSVFSQEFPDFEVIVVDDGSTDNTADVVAAYGDEVRLFRKENGGCASARNVGAREARGEYLAFLDSDDRFFPWTLATFAEILREKGKPSMVCGRLFNFYEEAELDGLRPAPLETDAGADYLEVAGRQRWALGVAHTVIRREVYLKAGGCLEHNINATDSDVLLKAGTAPGAVVVLRPYTLAYRKHAGATTLNLTKAKSGAEMLLQHEREGLYPGGPGRALERMEQVTIRTRAMTNRMVLAGEFRKAWSLYRQTLRWNLRLRRWRYLVAIPAASFIPPLRRLLPNPDRGRQLT